MSMTQQLMAALGGLGLFLLGMVLMTEGLRRLAGDSLHAWLTRFTRSPSTGALTGTISTAVLQSSSATTVTVVGFVAAGLLTFPQALGVVFGANLGTTITGWMVALLGFKLKIGLAALPLVLIGALARLYGHGRWKPLGSVLAGFGLIFLGIDFLQQGLAGLEGVLTPERFPTDSLTGRLLLIGLGALMVVVTQSSSAGVAIAMTALSVGALNFPQAACLVIGMDVGTTVTAVLASLGSSEAARRTGFSHTIYNVFTAVGALLLLDGYIWALDTALPGAISRNPELALVGFHTAFNLLAVLVGLPLAGQFARLMEWMVPSSERSLSRRLDERLLAEPRAALAALAATLWEAQTTLLQGIVHALNPLAAPMPFPAVVIREDLRRTRRYVDEINLLQENPAQNTALAHAIHALDHQNRMLFRLQQDDRIRTLRTATEQEPARKAFEALCRDLRDTPPFETTDEQQAAVRRLAESLRDDIVTDRDRAIRHAVKHDRSVAETGHWLAARRWLERMGRHVWRTTEHLGDLGFHADVKSSRHHEKTLKEPEHATPSTGR